MSFAISVLKFYPEKTRICNWYLVMKVFELITFCCMLSNVLAAKVKQRFDWSVLVNAPIRVTRPTDSVDVKQFAKLTDMFLQNANFRIFK